MSFRENLAQNFAPIPLRLVLATVFIYAGVAKIATTTEIGPEQAAILANMGHTGAQAAAAQSNEPAPPEALPDAQQEPEGESSDQPAAEPPASAEPEPEPAPVPEPEPTTDNTDEATETDSPDDPAAGQATLLIALQQRYTADDFAGPVKVTSLNQIALLMHAAAFPTQPGAWGYWPRWAGDGIMGISLAWAAALGEILFGIGMLFGFFTRLCALGICWTMGVAAWLTQMGPSIASGTALLGFLPGHAAGDSQAWMEFFVQLAMLGAALSVFFTGAGFLSLDHALFAPKPEPVRDPFQYDDDEEDDDR